MREDSEITRRPELEAPPRRDPHARLASPVSMPAVQDGEVSGPALRIKRSPELQPPPRESESRGAEFAPVRVIARERPRAPQRSTAGLLLTLGLFGVLILATLTVFVLLPRWVDPASPSGDAQIVAQDAAGAPVPDSASSPSDTSEPGTSQPGTSRPGTSQPKSPQSERSRPEALQARPAGAPKHDSDPSPPTARAGARPGSSVAARLADADDASARGDWLAAERAYAAALKLAPGHEKARAGLERARQAQEEARFQEAMSAALGALDEKRWDAARKAVDDAKALRPESTEVAEALARIDEAQRVTELERGGHLAKTLERAEDWHGAARAYQAILQIDPHLRTAREGRDRAQSMAELHDRLTFHLENRSRLSDAAVLEEVTVWLNKARAISAPGAALQRLTDSLGEVAAGYREPIVAQLRSDAFTDVTIYRIGHLGRFESRQLELRPGTYTVLGSRPGYRDVRLELQIEPGQAPAPLDVRCEERL